MKLSSFQLKVIALIFMFTEHFGRYLGELMPARVPLYLEYTGRIVAPIFFFLAVESYFKTSNRSRYIKRLYVWAIIMFAGNVLVGNLVKYLYQPENYFPIGQNIFLSIAFGISMVAAFEWAKTQTDYRRKWGGYGLAGFFVLASLFSDASYNGLAMVLVFYFFYNKKPTLYFAYAGLSLLFLLWGLTNRQYFWEFEFQWMMIAVLPLIMLYNGERGRYSLKYLFYTFYPLHIWALYFIRYFIGLDKL